MRHRIIATTLAALLAIAGIVATIGADGARGARTGAPAPNPAAMGTSSPLVADVAAARLATAQYVTDLGQAKGDGYGIITQMIPGMGYHFLNPKVSGFDVTKPDILVYEHHGDTWQLGALEWVFTSKPATPPLPGAKYGTFGAACHYVDGTFVFKNAQSKCPAKSPQSGAKFSFWHPKLVTLHFWVWYPNPAGIYSSMNPMVTPFNHG